MNLQSIPANEIYLDDDFNCRGKFYPQECAELAISIEKNGLLSPITIRELRTKATHDHVNEDDLVRKGYKYKIITGHRRYVAMARILNWDKIQCFVLSKDVSDTDCHDKNLIENLERQDLNMLQEAKALRPYIERGMGKSEIAERIYKDRGWVQSRMMLLELPEQVQEFAAKGMLSAKDIRTLYDKRTNVTELLQLAALMRDNFLSSLEKKIKPKSESKTLKKHRSPKAIFNLMETLREGFMKADRDSTLTLHEWVSVQGNSIVTRCLAWAAGEISNEELKETLDVFSALVGTVFVLPVFDEEVEKATGSVRDLQET